MKPQGPQADLSHYDWIGLRAYSLWFTITKKDKMVSVSQSSCRFPAPAIPSHVSTGQSLRKWAGSLKALVSKSDFSKLPRFIPSEVSFQSSETPESGLCKSII